ncbi:hypothetical protein AB0H07_47190, partial [Streptomyces sp. NPDC021354]|uniref:hypothetical protein n=1 Tax=Streptomyces sp. NPDC021354 TaxID=3154793 RepID=UPI003404DFFD
ELRSYDQVIRLEQDRLVYRARLRARYGRAWRRKAPVESLMPLRLARYGVPLAETAPAGLAAAGLDPAELTPTPQPAALPYGGVDDRMDELAGDPDRPALGAAESDSVPADHQRAVQQAESATSTASAHVQQSAVDAASHDYFEAVSAYISQYRAFPSARQLAWFLMEVYKITDPRTGGPLPEDQLHEVLETMKQQDAEIVSAMSGVSTMADVADTGSPAAMADPLGSANLADEGLSLQTSVAESAAAPRTYAAATASASMADDRPPGNAASEPASASSAAAATRSSSAPGTGQGGPRWEAMADTGAVAARLPRQQDQELEPGLDPEEQRIRMVAAWLAEAEDIGQKLSGAEVARRLSMSPRSGQRALHKAKEYREREAELRKRSRGHLRSVSDRP